MIEIMIKDDDDTRDYFFWEKGRIDQYRTDNDLPAVSYHPVDRDGEYVRVAIVFELPISDTQKG